MCIPLSQANSFPAMVAPRTLLAALLLCGAAASTRAQVAVDPRALDQLAPPAKPTVTRPTPPTVARVARPPAPADVDGPHQILPSIGRAPPGPTAKPAAAAATPGTVSVPAAPPPVPVLPPPIVVPARPVPLPPPPPVAADAPGSFSKLPGGLRVTFGPDRTDLNPDTFTALRTLVHAAPPDSGSTYSVVAYAAGALDDPSSARRLSLSRALTVRSVLVGEGIPSVHIYVKALGTPAQPAAETTSDRVDVTVTGGLPASPASAGQPPPPAAPTQKAAP
jgi:outer membrane protein OmpA-like peptidoglycan-associated protein